MARTQARQPLMDIEYPEHKRGAIRLSNQFHVAHVIHWIMDLRLHESLFQGLRRPQAFAVNRCSDGRHLRHSPPSAVSSQSPASAVPNEDT